MTRAQQLESGLYTGKRLPGPVSRRIQGRPVHVFRTCRDNRAYDTVPFTIPGTLTVGPQKPEWRVPRDYWVARVFAEVGRHDSATHPNDGTPAGSDLKIQLYCVRKDLSGPFPVLNSDSRLRITANNHQDAVNDAEDGDYAEGDFSIHYLHKGDRVYVHILQVGSTRAGDSLVTTLEAVPVPG